MDTKPLTKAQDVISFSNRLQNSDLTPVVQVFDNKEVRAALYSSDSHILNTKPKEGLVSEYGDVSVSRGFLVDLINQLLQDNILFRDLLNRDYKFTTVAAERVVTENDFKLWGNDPNLERMKKRYQEERFILALAMEQALTLIQQNPSLKFLITKLMTRARTGEPLTPDEIKACRLEVNKAGLDIVEHDSTIGFGGNPDNHGTLVFNNQTNAIELHLDKVGSDSVSEYVHELAAFLIIKKSGAMIRSQKDLDKAKNSVLAYTLLCVDLLKSARVDVRDYINI